MLAATPYPTRSTLWYSHALRPNGPKPSRRHGASAFVNGINAVDYWAHGNDPTYLIGCMRVQFTNLWELALHSDLSQNPSDDQKTALVTLLKECRDALYAFNPLTPQNQYSSNAAITPYSNPSAPQMAGQAFAQPMTFTPTSSSRLTRLKTASTQSEIESNAKAALGALAYLTDPNLFGSQGQSLYAFLQYRLQQAIALMEGSVTLADVISERQRLMAQQQQSQGFQVSQPGAYQEETSTYSPAPSASASAQSTVPSPVAGLKLQTQPWEGTPNRDENGQETVGSQQDWFTTYGTTLDQFAARCSRWMKANGGGEAALASHLRQNTVPENIIGRVMPYVR